MIESDWQWQSLLMIVGLVMSRMLVALSIIPIFSGNGVPGYIRIAFVAGLSLALLPLALTDHALTSIPLANMAPYLAKEAVIGLVLGLVASSGFWALYVAGTIIEYQAALSFATTIDPLTGQDDSLIGSFLMRLFTTLFLVTGGLTSLIAMLFDSYQAWPLSSMTPVIGNAQVVEVLLSAFMQMLLIAIKIAAPFVILMLLVETALGFLSRFAPQLNVFFLALPLKVLILAAMLLLYGLFLLGSGYALLPSLDFAKDLNVLRRVLP
jgi:type III secretion protein T